MANSYTKIYLHIVLCVNGRRSLISREWRDDLYKYINVTITNKGHKLYAIGGMPDHIHLLISMKPEQSLSSLIADIKRSSTLWINSTHLKTGVFSWQRGFGAFSYAQSNVHNVANYIERQEEHHKKRNFHEEYVKLLDCFGVTYDKQYLFQPV